MSLLFNNVELLGYSHQNNFFGEKSINYSITKNISIQGFVLDLANNNGISGIVGQINSIKTLAKNFTNIVINGQNYGMGKVTSLTFNSEKWVKDTRFNATITVLEEVPIENLNLNLPEFIGTNITNKKFNLIKSFSENFSLNFDNQNKILGGEHSIDIQYDANNSNINLIILAQSLAQELLKKLPEDLKEGSYNQRSKYKVLHTENYNLIDGKCGFNKKFSYRNENNDKPYSLNLTHSIELNEEGIATVNENCEIQAEYDVPSLHENSLIGLRDQLTGVYGRVDTFFQLYKSKLNITENLNVNHISKSIQINKFLGTISYNISFDNDPKKINPEYIYEYTLNLDRNEQGIWNSSETGSIRGIGKNGDIKKYENATKAWTENKGLIKNRLIGFFNSQATNLPPGSNLKELSKNVTKQVYEGLINYNYTFTSDPTILENDPDQVKKISIEKSDTGVLPIITNFIIPNKAYTLSQNKNLRKQGEYKVTVNLEIGCINGTFNGFNYFNRAKSAAGAFAGQGSDNYIESINFTSDEIEKRVSYQVNYKYS